MGSAFTQVLVNIYMSVWEQGLIKHQAKHKETYGRYIDDIFMTTNETFEIQIELEKAKKKDINIEIECTVDRSCDYFDVAIKNDNGQLRILVYHKPTAEPYYLPYTSNHPNRYHRNIPYSALMRAARLCSHVEDFNIERLRVQTSLLSGQHSSKLISNQFLRFFQVTNAISVLEELNQQVFRQLHQQVIHRITQRENKLTELMKDPVKHPAVLEKKS